MIDVSTPDCVPDLPADWKTMTVEQFWSRYPDNWGHRAPAPHLVLDRAPTALELRTLRRALARDNRLPRDGKLECLVPHEAADEVMELLYQHRNGSATPSFMYNTDRDGELGRFEQWTIVSVDRAQVVRKLSASHADTMRANTGQDARE